MEPPIQGVAASSATIRPRHSLRSPPPDRFLSFSCSNPSSSGDELTEDDIFDTSAEPASPESSSSPKFNHHQPRHHLTNFGILAALTASETRSAFNHKASASSATASVASSLSSTSSSRMIPTIQHPRRPPMVEYRTKMLHQSAPVNVPVFSAAIEEERRRRRGIDFIGEMDDDDDEGDGVKGEILPPHELVAARETPVVACSVLEGMGRTLKGRDLRRVRNAIWRKTASTMAALNQMVVTVGLFYALTLTRLDKFSASHVLVGSVTCLDCIDGQNGYDLSGIQVQVKCDHVKKFSMATTEQDGSFKIDDLPQDHPSSIDCVAKIIGGPKQLYISERNPDSKVVEVRGDDKHYYYTLYKPLNFYKSNPYSPSSTTSSNENIGTKPSQFGASKTFDVPVPREWGIAPSSYYFPFIPIIGIP